METRTKSRFILLFLFLHLSANADTTTDIDPISEARADILNKAFPKLIAKHNIQTLGVAVIKDRKIHWQNQYGFQSPGVKASSNTLFNVASLTKTVTAETILRLAEQGKLSLDEPIAPYWIDSDLENSPHSQTLTPRMLLTHTGGFKNWRYFSDNGKLSFITPPGTEFNYSGEGFEYLAKYAENKLKVPFDKLVQSTLFTPLNIKNASMSVNPAYFDRMTQPLDENGKFLGHYCTPYGYCSQQGSYSAAANLVVSVEDYAKLLISSMKGEGLSKGFKEDRDTMQGVQFEESDIDCSGSSDILCPHQLGYGLGWSISQLEQDKLIGHRGTNWSVISIAYYYQQSGDGLVLFFNAPNKAGLAGMIDALNLLDPDSPEIHGYKMRLARAN